MNFLNSIQSKLHGAVNPNSVQYIKQQDLQVQLDPSGTAYVDHGNQAFSLNVDDENTTALAILDKAPSTQPLSLSGQSQFTICLKHKVQDTTNPLIGQYFTNPQYDLSLSSTAVGTLDTVQVNAYKASDDPVSYSITGDLTSADLSNADLTGTLTNLHTPLLYTLRSGYGRFVFSLDGLSQQISATMYKKYWVKSVTNLLGDLVFGFSSTGSGGDYFNQPDISFGAGGKYMFDVSDPTMTDLSLVFGTTVDVLSTVNDSVVTRTNDLVIVDIGAGYTDERLVYFEDTSADMGYVAPSSAGGTLKNYTVDVSNNSVFRLDSGDGNGFEDKPAIAFANNSGTTYVFDQSHDSNTGNTLVIGTAPDISSSIVSSGLTIMGTPGQTGAYTKYVSNGTPLYYFSYQNQNMGYEKSPQGLFHVFSPELETYRIEIRAKRLGDYIPMNINVIKTDTLGNETTTLVDTVAPGTGWNNFTLDFTVEPIVNMIRISIEGQYNFGSMNFSHANQNRLIVLDHVKLFHVNDDNTISTTNLLKGYNMDLSSNNESYLSGTNNNGWDIGSSNVVQITSNAIYNTGSDDGNVIILHKLGSLYQDLEIQRNYSYVSATQIYNTDVSFINYNSPVGDFSYTDDATKNFQTGSNVYFTYFGGSIESTVTYDNANITNNAWTTPSEGNYTVIATKLGDAYYRDVSASTTFTVSTPNITDDLYVHYDFELPLYDANGTAYSTDVTGGSNSYADQSIRFYNKAYDSITNSDISYNMYVIRGSLVSDPFKVGSRSFKTYESSNYGASRIGDYSFRLNSTKGYSICFWMKEISGKTSKVDYPLMGFGNTGNSSFFHMKYDDTPNFIINNNGTTLTHSISSLPITNWNHIAFTISSNGSTWKLYINESLVNTKTDGTLLTSVNPVSGYPTDSVWIFDIGLFPGSGGYQGHLDDFRFYKTEISAAQVSAVYSYTG